MRPSFAKRRSLLWACLLVSGASPLRADSLWFRDGTQRSLYSPNPIPDLDYKINDLILVIVEETGTARNNSNTNLRRKFDLSAEVSEFASLQGLALRAASQDSLPSIDIKSEKRQEGRGSTDRTDRVSFRITARIIDVRPNNNLVIEGHTTRRINDEESILTIFGEVDPMDIQPRTRAVNSERIGDLKIGYTGRGVVTRNMGRTIIGWLAEWLWPF